MCHSSHPEDGLLSQAETCRRNNQQTNNAVRKFCIEFCEGDLSIFFIKTQIEINCNYSCKGDRKIFHPRTAYEGPNGKQMYSSTLPSTSALDGGWVVSTTPRPLYHREGPGTHCIGGGWAPGPFWTGAENLERTGTRLPDSPACSESLYRLSYRGPLKRRNTSNFSPQISVP